MADERDFELLDDYLTRHMSEENRTAFKQKLQADPDLQHEYALQKRVVQGIRDARVAELKSMLNKVPVPPNNPGNTVVSKIIVGAVVSLLIAAAGYWYFKQDQVKPPQADTVTHEPAPKVIEEPTTPDVKPLQKPEQKPPAVIKKPQVEADKNQTSAGTEHSKPSLAKRPDAVHEPAPGEKSGEQGATEQNTGDDNLNTASPLIVETNRENTRFTFHYQFQEGKLVLFGPFEQNQYEVVKFAGEQPALFLYYNDRFYGLDRADDSIRPLEPVTDPAVLKKLTEYLGSK